MVDAPALAPGTPVWVDVASPDLEASRKFYGALFGWEAQVAPQEEAGGYTIFTLKGKRVAGLGPTFSPEQPPAWSTYVSTSDADATAQAVRDAGGQVVMGPMDIMEEGRMAVFTDPSGAFISVWQPKNMPGAELYNEIGTFGWNDLNVRDVESVKPFYKKVFDWDAETETMPSGGSYTQWKLAGRGVAGAFQMGDDIPPEVPPHWQTYFVVENCNDAVAKVQELGGSVIVPPMDIDIGIFAIVSDPHHALFAVFQGKS